ncbi:uncharacterized protein LOC144499581 [Mustelus asterias]
MERLTLILIAGILLISWIWVEGTPGHQLTEKLGGFHLAWKNSTHNRTQGEFTCGANRMCGIANITSVCKLYRCEKCLDNNKALPTTAMNCTVTITAGAPLCQIQTRRNRTCMSSKENGTTWNITVTGERPRLVWFQNSTEIKGRNTFLYAIMFLPNKPIIEQTQFAPVLHTCRKMANQLTHTEVHWTVILPSLPTCSGARRRRAWYDTLLGGTGTVLGISNAADNEVTRTMLSDTGYSTSHGLHTVGIWMPTVVKTQVETARILLRTLDWEKRMWNATQELMHNITAALNMTICNIQGVHMRVQQERFIRIVTTGNSHELRELWNISDTLWVQARSDKTVCNKTACTGHYTLMNVADVISVCKYHVLPVITLHGFYFLRTNGNWFSPKNNWTYDLSTCEDTDRGLACLTMTRYRDPCLTDDTALCEWRVEKPRDILWQIGPHAVCVATIHRHPLLPQIPFSGCLKGVYIWHWANKTYKLTNYSTESRLSTAQWKVLHMPWRVSLDRFKCALNQSTELKHIIDSHKSNVSRVMVSTFIAGEQAVHAARMIENESAHHWWDLLTGISQMARRYVLPPLILIFVIVAVLTCCNVLTCVYVRRVKQGLESTLYHTALR